MSNEFSIRIGCFLGIFFFIALLETIIPRRKPVFSRLVRWYSNLGITVIDSLLLRWMFPLLAVDMALFADEQNWGVFNAIEFPYWFEVAVSVIILDLVIYLQHITFHSVPSLWRFHRMHHTDLDFDVTTGLRFHPLEIILSMLLKLAAINLLGLSMPAVLIFEVLLNGSSLFNHGNIYISEKLDRILRLLIVTPDMHRIHHSLLTEERNSNFGFAIPWWDRLFGSYCDMPQKDHTQMQLGVEIFRNTKYLHLPWLLIQPFFKSRYD